MQFPAAAIDRSTRGRGASDQRSSEWGLGLGDADSSLTQILPTPAAARDKKF